MLAALPLAGVILAVVLVARVTGMRRRSVGLLMGAGAGLVMFVMCR